MRRINGLLAAALIVSIASPAAAAGGGGAAKKGPEGIPFSCSDGRSLRVVYSGGGMRAKAKLKFEDSSYELKAAPTPLGRRYIAEGQGSAMVWFTDGVHSSIREAASPAAPAAEDREIASCHRSSGEAHAEYHDKGKDHKGEVH